MNGGWQYRITSVVGTAALATSAVAVANHTFVQGLFQLLPLVGHLPFDSTAGREFVIEASITTIVVCAALFPLYKPRPRRILNIGLQALRRVSVALLALATIGYFDFTYRLPRATLVVVGAVLFVVIPPWFVVIRRRPHPSGDRTIIIGDNPETMADILKVVEGKVLGYVSPPSAYTGGTEPYVTNPEVADGGNSSELDNLANLGGLSRLDEILVDHDVGTAVLAFAQPDRGDFFGALDSCYEHGVAAKVHREHADIVLTSGTAEGKFMDIELEPWDWLDHIVKRVFDVVFAVTALLALSPLLLIIAAAIKFDSSGPVLYRQTRTAAFGDTFTVAKFRTMVPESEDPQPIDDSKNNGITRVGRVLRTTHLDELPQLVTILRGQMSVVGPRAAWIDEETLLENQTEAWRRRWFVKPGLTGLAQINDVSSTNPEAKLRYDIEYIRNQSFWFDLKIVVRQLWMVGEDFVENMRS